jgi:hypothetical protein
MPLHVGPPPGGYRHRIQGRRVGERHRQVRRRQQRGPERAGVCDERPDRSMVGATCSSWRGVGRTRGRSSVGERSPVRREVAGSIPAVPVRSQPGVFAAGRREPVISLTWKRGGSETSAPATWRDPALTSRPRYHSSHPGCGPERHGYRWNWSGLRPPASGFKPRDVTHDKTAASASWAPPSPSPNR